MRPCQAYVTASRARRRGQIKIVTMGRVARRRFVYNCAFLCDSLTMVGISNANFPRTGLGGVPQGGAVGADHGPKGHAQDHRVVDVRV